MTDRFDANWYRKAAEQGGADAQYQLAEMYHRGHGVPQDSKQAARWYRKAAEKNSAPAMLNLGQLYVKGDGVPKSDRRALEWIKKSALAGNKQAMELLSRCYENGWLGLPQDPEQQRKWRRLARQAKE